MSWNYFDKIYCISLESRKDRQRNAIEQFDKVGLRSKVEFYLAIKDQENSERGIYNSHINCLQIGIQHNAQTILVFEDDIIFDRFSPVKLQEIVHFLHKEDAWNIFFFGCMVNGIQQTKYPSVAKIDYKCSAHAYVVNRPFADRIVSFPWENIAYDDFLREKINNSAYAASPFFAFQSNSVTDNKSTLKLAKFRELCGGVTFIQKANEFYHLHKRKIWLLHFLFAILLIFMLTYL
jgi:GR25 family glycosyltransferase involved in LPS biosynthesis